MKKKWKKVSKEEVISFIESLLLPDEAKEHLKNHTQMVAETKNEYLLWRALEIMKEENAVYCREKLN